MRRIIFSFVAMLALNLGCEGVCLSGDCVDVCTDGVCRRSGQPAGCHTHADCGYKDICLYGACYFVGCEAYGCPDGHFCSLERECRQIISGCPLTDECLPDPMGYNPDWMGIDNGAPEIPEPGAEIPLWYGSDPLYMGYAEGAGMVFKMEAFFDFYDDHFYGEVAIQEALPGLENVGDYYFVVTTGMRDGSVLSGVVISAEQSPREYDALIDANLISASEIRGVVTVHSDAGDFEIVFQLLRISECGCEPVSCEKDTQCASGEICESGVCQPECNFECCSGTDCAAGQQCVDHRCVCTAPPQCLSDANCEDGDECVEGVCRTPCVGPCVAPPCDCEADESCVDGYCQGE